MMRFSLSCVVSITWLLGALAAPASAQDPAVDAEGCKESKLLSRMPGCIIESCGAKEFDSAELVINKEAETKALEGAVEQLTLTCPGKSSPLQIMRNAEAALRKAGYTIMFAGPHANSDTPVVTGQKGAQWISVQTRSGGEDATNYEQTAVLVQAMAQQMAASAQAMADAIASTGRLDVYGITFATGQATITPQSDKVLADVLAVLTANADWKLRVEGHTDNVGAPAANQKLSEARAGAVVAWLVKQGVAANRLSASGLGDAQPVEANSTDAGRAKNRRVVLIKQ